MAFKIASGVIDITLKGVSGSLSGLKKIGMKLGGVAKSAGRLVLKIGAVATAFATIGAGFAIRDAARAEESLSAFTVVFKDLSEEAGVFADSLAKSIGRSSLVIKEGLTTFQAFFKGIGFGAREAFELSKRVQKLALDTASLFNKTDEDAQQRFLSALAGSSEVLDKFGVNIRVAQLAEEARSAGIKTSIAKMTEQQKIILRLRIMMKALTDAENNAADTAGSFTNQVKRLKGNLLDLSISIGTQLLPTATKLVAAMNENQGAVLDFAKSISTIAKVFGTVFSFMSKVMGNFSKVVDTAWDIFVESGIVSTMKVLSFFVGFATSVGHVVLGIGANFIILGINIFNVFKTAFINSWQLAKNFFKLMIDGFKSLMDSIAAGSVKPLKDFGARMGEAMIEGLKGADLTEFINIDTGPKSTLQKSLEAQGEAAGKRLDRAMMRMGNIFAPGPAGRGQPGGALGGGGAPAFPDIPGGKGTGTDTGGFGGQILGLTAVFDKIQAAVLGEGKDAVAKKQLKQAEVQTKIQEQINEKLVKIALPGLGSGPP